MTTDSDHIRLPITGMSCAACAARVEKGLNRLEGVRASVNYATEVASVDFDPRVTAPERLVEAVERAGYGARLPRDADEADPQAADRRLRVRLVVSAVLAAPVAVMSMVPATQFDYWQWVALALATPVTLWGGWPFHRAAWAALRHGGATMDTLISVGTLAAWGWSVVAMVLLDAGHPGMRMHMEWTPSHETASQHIYLEVAAMVCVLVLLGRYLETRARGAARASLSALARHGAGEARRRDPDGVERMVPAHLLQVDDVIVVRPGERIASDGQVIEGASHVDNALITGESAPVARGVDDEVVGGTVNLDGRLVVRATRVGADTALAQIGRMVAAAQEGKAPVQRLADRVAAVFVPAVIGLSIATFVAWMVVGRGITFAFTAAVAVLIIACPCALGLATPTALMVGTGRGAQLGILIRGPEVLESTRRIDTIVLDKTGTLTEARMGVTAVHAVAGEDPDRVIAMAAAAEEASEHPAARAIVADAARRGLHVPPATQFTNHEGRGVSAVVDGHLVQVGRLSWLAPPDDGAPLIPDEEGATQAGVAWGGRLRGVVWVRDTVRPEAADAVARLTRMGIEPHMVTGDNASAAAHVAGAVGITHVMSDALPADKATVVAGLQDAGRVVAVVGDGVNDAPALARADLGMAIGSGTDVAIEASDITLTGTDLRGVPDAIHLARRTLATIKGNLFWAFGYNVIAIPAAALGYLNPVIAAAAMALSSLFVVGNSLRLRGFSPSRHERSPSPLRP